MRGELARRGVRTDVELCERLLQEAGVAALPGACFGMPERSMYVRLALVDFDAARAIEMSASAPPNEPFLRAFLKPTWEAVKAVRRWVQHGPREALATSIGNRTRPV